MRWRQAAKMRGGPGVSQQLLLLVLEGRVRLDEGVVGERGVEVVGWRRRKRRRKMRWRRRGECVGFIVVREEFCGRLMGTWLGIEGLVYRAFSGLHWYSGRFPLVIEGCSSWWLTPVPYNRGGDPDSRGYKCRVSVYIDRYPRRQSPVFRT